MPQPIAWWRPQITGFEETDALKTGKTKSVLEAANLEAWSDIDIALNYNFGKIELEWFAKSPPKLHKNVLHFPILPEVQLFILAICNSALTHVTNCVDWQPWVYFIS